MAPSACSRGPGRQLRELLREQQEPFLLDVYLLEKNRPRKCSDSEAHGNENCLKLSEKLIGTSTRSRNGKKKALLRKSCSALIRSVLGRFGHGGRGERYSGSGANICSIDGRFSNSVRGSGIPSETRFREEDCRVSAASGAISEGEDWEVCPTSPGLRLRCLKLHSIKAQARNQYWRYIQDFKQRSPVSVLEVPTSDQGSPASSHKTDEVSNSTWPLSSSQMEENLIEKIADKMGLRLSEDQVLPGFSSSSSSSSSSQTSTRVLKQTKKLLVDCIKEAEQNYTKKTRRSSTPHAHTSIPKLENFVCDQILSWANAARNQYSKHLARAVSFKSEWLRPESQICREIGVAISDAIFVQTIDEVVTDIYTPFSSFCMRES